MKHVFRYKNKKLKTNHLSEKDLYEKEETGDGLFIMKTVFSLQVRGKELDISIYLTMLIKKERNLQVKI